jgi:ABC-type transporter Mla MlaB component
MPPVIDDPLVESEPVSGPNAIAAPRCRLPSRPRPGGPRPVGPRPFGCVLVHEVERGAVAFLRGDLDAASAPSLLRLLVEVLELPLERLTLHLADVDKLDPHGTAALHAVDRAARSREIELTLEAVPERWRAALQSVDGR